MVDHINTLKSKKWSKLMALDTIFTGKYPILHFVENRWKEIACVIYKFWKICCGRKQEILPAVIGEFRVPGGFSGTDHCGQNLGTWLQGTRYFGWSHGSRPKLLGWADELVQILVHIVVIHDLDDCAAYRCNSHSHIFAWYDNVTAWYGNIHSPFKKKKLFKVARGTKYSGKLLTITTFLRDVRV